MIKLEGRVLLSDVVNRSFNKISKDCKIAVPEKVPLSCNFESDKTIGYVSLTKDSKGVYADILTDGKICASNSYIINKMHKEGELDVIDEITLTDIELTLAPVRDEYYLKIKEAKE